MTQSTSANLSPGTSLAARACIGLVRLYQVTLSPFVGRHCRFQPTCSNYAIEALRAHGAFRGCWLAFRRLSRCHPMGGAGYDPVPVRDPENASEHPKERSS